MPYYGMWAGGGLPVAAPPPSPGFPVPPFGATNLLSWVGTAYSAFETQDTFFSTTISALADLSGNANGWVQPFKTWQPTVGGFGGALFGAGTWLDCVYNLLLTGFSAITVGFTVALSSGAAQRTLLAMSNGVGNGDVLTLNLTSGGVLTAFVNPNDGGATYTTLPGAALSLSVKHTVVCRLDLSGTVNAGVGTVDLNVDGGSYLGAPATFSLTGSPPWPLAPGEYPLAVRMGNERSAAFTAPSPDKALVGEMTGAVFLSEYCNAGRLAQINSWLVAQ